MQATEGCYLETHTEGFPPNVVLQSDAGICKISLYGAQVLSFIPKGSDDLLWVSEQAHFKKGKAIRGGIPLCWPWFGPHPADASKPAHGFARISEWKLTESGIEDATPFALLTLESDERTRQLFDYAFVLQLTVKAGKKLEVSLTTHNRDNKPFTITEALHTYLPVSAIEQASIEGLHGTAYIDQLQANRQMLQKGAIRFNQETDRIYTATGADCILRDAKRTIRIAKKGSTDTVVWNPWIDKSKRMEDFGDEEFRGMLCIETANAAADAVTVPPGGSHTITAVIGVDA